MEIKVFFANKMRLFSLVLGFVLLAIIGYFDKVTGREMSYAALYLIAICYITWFAGRTPGLLASLASALNCFFDEYSGADFTESPLVPYWNAANMLGVFLIVSYLLSELKGILKTKKQNGK